MRQDRVLVIAEAGVNHNGDLTIAKRLIQAAASAGADVVKFQTFSADRIVTRKAAKADYQSRTTAPTESQHAMLSRLELSSVQYEELIAHCAANGIRFLSTGFDIESVNLLARLGQTVFKVPSGEITNLPLLQHVGAMRREVALSTGMATLAEVEAALGALTAAGTPLDQITVLHCTSEYPAPASEVNLRAMLTMQEAFGVQIGYSDHSEGTEIAIAATALGARVIEKHFTTDRGLPGPDHRASLEPHELKSLVTAIRKIEQALGDGVKRPTASEERNRPVARKSIVASRAIKAGELFTTDNVTVKRPGTGVSPMLWHEVLGRRAERDFSADELITL